MLPLNGARVLGGGQARQPSLLGIREELEMSLRESDGFGKTVSLLEGKMSSLREGDGFGKTASLLDAQQYGIEHRYRNEKPELRKSRVRNLFADREQMKEDLREKVFKQQYDVKRLYKKHGCSSSIARSEMFAWVQMLMIIFNTVWLGIDTELNAGRETQPMFVYMASAFCTFFVLEILIRFNAFKDKRQAFGDSWFAFDFSLVVLMVIETWILPIANLSPLSRWSTVIRLVRFARVARFVRLIGSFPELLILFRGMFVAVRSMFFTLVLLFLLAYIFAIAFKLSYPPCPLELQGLQPAQQLLPGEMPPVLPSSTSPACKPFLHFNSLPQGMLFLLVQGTLLDGVGNMIADMVVVSSRGKAWYILVGILAYVFLSAFTVLNLLIGVICEAVSSVAIVYREETQIQKITERLGAIIHKWLKGKEDAKISKDMFVEMLLANEKDQDEPGIAGCLHKVGVDIIGLVDIVDTFFDDQLDSENSESQLQSQVHGSRVLSFSREQRELTFEELMDIVLNLRGSNAVTVKDLVHHRKLLSRSQTALVEALNFKIHEQLTEAFHQFGIHRKESAEDSQFPPSWSAEKRESFSDSSMFFGLKRMGTIGEFPEQPVSGTKSVGKIPTQNADIPPSMASMVNDSIARAEDSLREARAQLDEILSKASPAAQSLKEPRELQQNMRSAQRPQGQSPLARVAKPPPIEETWALGGRDKLEGEGHNEYVPPSEYPLSAESSGRRDSTKPLSGSTSSISKTLSSSLRGAD